MAVEETTTKLDYMGRMFTHLAWEKLEKGDEVAFLQGYRSYYGLDVKMYTVDRLTATQIIMTDASRWYRKNGEQVASNDRTALMHPQDDRVISTLLEQEHRAFKQALVEASKIKTTSVPAALLEQRGQVENAVRKFGARVLLLEAKRRKPADADR